jgi:hypothetical protein
VSLSKLTFGFCTAALMFTTVAMAQGSGDMLQPDAPPPSDMLKPSQVNYDGESANPANDSGFFLGGGLSFGQAKSTDGGSAGLAMLFGVEPGYQINTGSWSRVELSGELMFGNVAFREPTDRGGKSELSLGMGFLAKIGLGYSIGNKMFGVTRFGVGPVLAKYEADPGVKIESTDTLSGLAVQVGYDLIFPMTSALDAVGGLSWTHMQFDIDEVEDNGGNKLEADRPLNVNTIAAEAGLRLRF